jgi:hypothetical protein
MVKRYTGGIMSANTVSTTNSSASGFFNSANHIQLKQAGNWPVQYSRPISMDYLVVAGGGAGGGWIYDGGGGGGGGLLTASGVSITSGTLTVNVGAGGAYTYNVITPGTSSNISGLGISTVTTTGGGGGSSYNVSYLNGGNGGSGGGGSGAAGGKGIYPGSSYIDGPRQGYDGGTGNSGSRNAAGGGGGAGQAGAAGVANGAAGKGGDGVQSSITGTATYYAGGGGGSSESATYAGGAGGLGGGGAGAGNNQGFTAGEPNTGGGAGGGYAGSGVNGGSGTVIIRYSDSYSPAVSTIGVAVGYPVVTSGYRIYKWITSGSITF